ncbi:hypothetical protein KPSA3_03904 [Pseudomonas syringae pv. actinidiae]|uniref:Uncharacterized protein n=1 Tax=Pseudomonas syringae pv. actinidiae TaxID=103796 RepID=A0AAN4TM84_PSESF|nr:hypothetical protein KPSA3_03904 [Pseudomonas syringae pv. actinidiae]
MKTKSNTMRRLTREVVTLGGAAGCYAAGI